MNHQIAINNYTLLMEEVRGRHESVVFALTTDKLPFHVVRELCFLQYRMICELIAFGALVVHGDIEAANTERMKNAYAADFIMKALEKQHEHFFPQPLQENSWKPGEHGVGPLQGKEFLTKEDAIKLYSRCGDVLHRGTFNKISKQKKLEQSDYDELQTINTKIVNLLNFHCVFLSDNKNIVMCMLKNPDTGRVQCAIATKGDGPPRLLPGLGGGPISPPARVRRTP